MNSQAITKVFKLNNVINRTLSATSRLSKEDATAKNKSKQTNTPTTTNKSGQYQAQEYFNYDSYSYFDIENDMVKYRLPQPSALPKIEFTWSQLPPKQKK